MNAFWPRWMEWHGAECRLRAFSALFLGAVALLLGVMAAFLPWKLVLVCFAFGLVFFVGLADVRWTLCALVVLFPSPAVFFIHTVIDGEPLDLRLPVSVPPALVFALFALMWRRWAGTTREPVHDPMRHPLALLLSYGVLTMFWSPRLDNTVLEYAVFLANVLIYAFFVRVIGDERTLRSVMGCFVLWGALQGVFTLASYFAEPRQINLNWDIADNLRMHAAFLMGPGSMPGSPESVLRGASLFAERHLTGCIANMTYAIAVGLLLAERGLAKRILGAAIAFLMMAITFLSMSLAAVGALVIENLFLFAAIGKLRRRLGWVVLGFLVILSVEFRLTETMKNALMGAETPSRIVGKAAVAGEDVTRADVTGGTRASHWHEAWQALKQTDGLGVGTGNTKLFTGYHEHNILYSFVVQYGYVGFAAVVWMIAALFQRYRGQLQHQSSYAGLMCVASLAGLVGMLAHGMLDFHYNLSVFWVYLGMVVATLNLAIKEREPAVSPDAPQK